ncbi:MarR family transcriptional regulator [Thermophilibacter provencensis]|uniref:MarR family transcriptional regulator n=1 Tax=Thermophilibacter provencensis TaxID=1852386 RepID=A0ABT7V3P4_9ACTN|nr:MarR family transcriptional regulator [Thermophilibacter provencensis]MDM8271205.1 MarR family transcriptional regulator [Thermophilibacter provencensis]
MDLREYMSVRRAYNNVRQKVKSDERLTFEEFAILCRLNEADEPIKTSSIAEYQGALRPTMTHRTNHLAGLGLIDRAEGVVDHRNVVCSISEKGREHVMELASLTRGQIPTGRALSRTSPERVVKYVDAMGSLFCKAGDLVLLGLLSAESESLTIMQIVEALGLLQPTVSMSVTSLEEKGLVSREHVAGGSHTTSVSLTDAGSEYVGELAKKIEALVVRRKGRGGSSSDEVSQS